MSLRHPSIILSVRSLWLAAVVSVAIPACSQGQSGAESDTKTPAANPAAPTPAPAADDEQVVDASAASQVSGAFLAACSDDTDTTYVKKADEANDVTACLLKTADGELADVENLHIEVVRKDGSRFVPDVVTKEVSSAPWQIAARLDAVARADAASYELSYNEAGKAAATAATEDSAYDWANDQLFQQFMTELQTLFSVFQPAQRVDFDESGVIALLVLQQTPFHFAFVTEAFYTGDLGGLEGADAKCAAAGVKFATDRTWRAILGTSKVAPRDRLGITAHVMNYYGHVVSDPNKFWSGELVDGIHFTELGFFTEFSVFNTPTPTINRYSWSGSTDLGAADPAGNFCQDWTSSAHADFGGNGVPSNRKLWAESRARRCDKTARIVCISSAAATPLAAQPDPEAAKP